MGATVPTGSMAFLAIAQEQVTRAALAIKSSAHSGHVMKPIMMRVTDVIADAILWIWIVWMNNCHLVSMNTAALEMALNLRTRPNVYRRIHLDGRAHSQTMAMVYTAIVGAALWMPTAAVKRPAVTPQHA